MEDWDRLMEGKTFITDLGAGRPLQPEGADACLGRYAVWSPVKEGPGHVIVEVGGELAPLMERYSVSPDLVCTLVS